MMMRRTRSRVIHMRDVTVQQRLEMSKTLQAVCSVMDECGCGSEKELNADADNVDERLVVRDVKRHVEKEVDMTATGNTTTEAQTGINTNTDEIFGGTITTTMATSGMAEMNGIVNEHDQDFNFPEVDPDDHEYLHKSDVPQPVLAPQHETDVHQPLLAHLLHNETQDDSDLEIQPEYKDGRVDVGATIPVHNVDEDEEKPKSKLQVCEKCKRQAKLAECLEAAVVDMNSSVRSMNDYIVECAHHIEALEQCKKKHRQNRKKNKRNEKHEEKVEGNRTGPSVEKKKKEDPEDHEENERCSVNDRVQV